MVALSCPVDQLLHDGVELGYFFAQTILSHDNKFIKRFIQERRGVSRSTCATLGVARTTLAKLRALRRLAEAYFVITVFIFSHLLSCTSASISLNDRPDGE